MDLIKKKKKIHPHIESAITTNLGVIMSLLQYTV